MVIGQVLSDLYQIFTAGFFTGLGVSGAAVLIGFTVRRLAGFFR